MKSEIRNKYEIWESDNGCQLSCGLAEFVQQGIIHDDGELLHSFIASTHEEAMSIFHHRVGYEPYKPQEEPAPCPNECGSFYYPNGSRQCPYCGQQ